MRKKFAPSAAVSASRMNRSRINGAKAAKQAMKQAAMAMPTFQEKVEILRIRL